MAQEGSPSTPPARRCPARRPSSSSTTAGAAARCQKKRQTDDAVLRQVRNLTKDLFTKLGPSSETELYAFYVEQFSTWKKDLEAYRSKTEVGRFPGRAAIESTLKEVERLLCIDDSFDFFKAVAEQQEALRDLRSTPSSSPPGNSWIRR